MISQETGQDTETLHEVCKTKFLLHSVKINEEYVMVGRSTTSLSTVEFEKYLEDIRRWASEFLGLYIPLPNEINF